MSIFDELVPMVAIWKPTGSELTVNNMDETVGIGKYSKVIRGIPLSNALHNVEAGTKITSIHIVELQKYGYTRVNGELVLEPISPKDTILRIDKVNF